VKLPKLNSRKNISSPHETNIFNKEIALQYIDEVENIVYAIPKKNYNDKIGIAIYQLREYIEGITE